VSFVYSERILFNLQPGARVIQGFSTSFDASVEEIWLAFASGSALVVVQKEVMQDAERLQELIGAEAVTVLSTVPTLLATMEPALLEKIELVIVGGEACNKEVVEMYATKHTNPRTPKREMVNSYGPTEATVACCATYCTPGEIVTIGRAQPNYYALIIDPDHPDCLRPPGAPGELCMAGPGVTRGYVNRPELTEQKFIPCDAFPHMDATHGNDFRRMYRTGDLVRWTYDGQIEFLGRIDSQVKLRGFRIEVGEIENVLAQFPGVSTAVVILRNDHGVPYLCAYVKFAPGTPHVEERHLRTHLKASLPAYMVPARFVPIENLPRSPPASSTARRSPPPRRRRRTRRAPRRRRARRRRRSTRSTRFGPSCSAPPAPSASTTTSSRTSGGTRCWRAKWPARCVGRATKASASA